MADNGVVQIIPFYSQPHVHTVIRNNSQYEETVQPTTISVMPYATAIVIGADKGISDTFVRINDLDTKQKIFGKPNYDKYGQPSLQVDELLNGRTDVWICRVLPDNALYANLIWLAHYRKGKILDELGQETGKVRLEIKFSVVSLTKANGGAVEDDDIDAYARSFATGSADPLTGYITVPIAYARMIGKGQYGNQYSISIARDPESEKDYNTKMYKFSLIDNSEATAIDKQFVGSLVSTFTGTSSTLISDVLDQYTLGSCPITITPYSEYVEQLFKFYHDQVVNYNFRYMSQAGATQDELEELKKAQAVTATTFDPFFGYEFNTRYDEQIPYYCNFTATDGNVWIKPDLEVPNVAGAMKPLNLKDWSAARVGSRVLVASDPLNKGLRWLYTITAIDSTTGNILYDEGVQTSMDADQYDGINVALGIGQMFDGGHDGDFQEITVNGVTRTPNSAEMKLLLAREYVKAFRGQKDRKILSPARTNIDFIFDANYNLTSDETLEIDNVTSPIYANSTILTDKDNKILTTVGISGNKSVISEEYTDLNVKQAIWDLNDFRCRNGMTVSNEMGAGCSVYFDCGLVGLKDVSVNSELKKIINMMKGLTGRQVSVDLGYYYIYDKVTGKKVPVTVTYFIAQNLVSHILRESINKPFTYNYAQITAIQNDESLIEDGTMIRDSFRPDIDLIDWDVKELLYKSRINYWITSEEDRIVQRACQNTRETDASALLEESNVRVLNLLKKRLEKSTRGYLYEWNEPEVRKGFTDVQMQIYRPWIGTIVEDLKIKFTANEWEHERMMMHCYVDVKFRGIAKRIILEININKSTYQTD